MTVLYARRFQFSLQMLLFLHFVVAAVFMLAYPYRLKIICWAIEARDACNEWKQSPLPPPTAQDFLAIAIVLGRLLFMGFVAVVRSYNRSRDEI